MRQKQFLEQAGDEAVIWIRPNRVTKHAGTKWPVGKARIKSWRQKLPKAMVDIMRPWIKAQEPFVIPSAVFGHPRPVEDDQRYGLIADYIEQDGRLEATVWYRDLMQDLSDTGMARHKDIRMTSKTDVIDFFKGYVDPLISSLRRDGYHDPKNGFESSAVLDANGNICKAGSGNHRFCISHILGLPAFPLRIVAIHEDHAGTNLTLSKALDLIRSAETRFK